MHEPDGGAAAAELDVMLEFGRPTKRQYSHDILSRKDHMLGAACFSLEKPEYDGKRSGKLTGAPPERVPTKLERDTMVRTVTRFRGGLDISGRMTPALSVQS